MSRIYTVQDLQTQALPELHVLRGAALCSASLLQPRQARLPAARHGRTSTLSTA